MLLVMIKFGINADYDDKRASLDIIYGSILLLAIYYNMDHGVIMTCVFMCVYSLYIG